MLAKSKLNRIEVLNSKVLIDSNISHNEVVLINNELKEYERRNKKIKDLSSSLKILVYL